MKRRYAYLCPFSHSPGASCLIPGTSYVIQAFPSKLFVYHIDDEERKPIKELFFETKGPLKNFTLFQDLEKGGVSCTSESFRVFVTPNLEFLSRPCKQALAEERLCLGVYKQQEVEKIRRRNSLNEIFPLLFRLGNQLKIEKIEEKEGVFSLLEACFKNKKPEKIKETFEALFLSGFSPFFIPQNKDPEKNNLYPETETSTPILALLTKTAIWIRSLFFLSENDILHFLPHLPPECVYGKMFDMKTDFGTINFSWSKKQIKTVYIYCKHDASIKLRLASGIKQYRFNEGKNRWKMNSETILHLQADKKYHLDCFEK